MVPCPAGTYREVAYDQVSECVPCPPNHYREHVKGTSPRSCSKCPLNTSSRQRSTSAKHCVRCRAGTMSTEGGDCKCITPQACDERQLPFPAEDENAMLLQQADLLAKELNDAHASIAERDSSISVLSSELSGLMEKARTLMIEKKTWKTEIMDKETEIESLHTREKQSNSLRSELSATVEQMQVDLESTRAEAEMLISSTTRSVSEMEELRATLLLKQNEVERFDGERREMERELCSVRRDVKTSRDAKDNSILHIGCQNGSKRIAKLALRFGADINEQNESGNTALHYCSLYSKTGLMQYLISKGADITIRNNEGRLYSEVHQP